MSISSVSGTLDDTRIAWVLVIFSVFSLVVLSQYIGIILLAYSLLYLIAISRKPVFAFQLSSKPAKLLSFIAIPAAMFFVLVIVSDFVIGSLNLGSSLALYSSALQPIVTIDTPVVRFLIWGVLIPILETCFFIGIIGYLISGKLKVREKLDLGKFDTYFVMAMVGVIAAVFHIVAQLTTPELLVMDVMLFSASMGVTLYYQELKQAMMFHIFLNSAAMIFVKQVFSGGVL